MKSRALNLLIILSFPLLMIWIAVEIIASPRFISLAYQSSFIAADRLGLLTSDRQALANQTLDLTLGTQSETDILSSLSGISLPNSDTLYTQPEIDHLIDVNELYLTLRNLGISALAIVIIGIGLLAIKKEFTNISKILIETVYFSLFLLVLIGITMLFAWSFFFDYFHQLLFPPGTWMFPVDSGLIRLFPEQFWQLVAASLVMIILTQITLIIIIAHRLRINHREQTN